MRPLPLAESDLVQRFSTSEHPIRLRNQPLVPHKLWACRSMRAETAYGGLNVERRQKSAPALPHSFGGGIERARAITQSLGASTTARVYDDTARPTYVGNRDRHIAGRVALKLPTKEATDIVPNMASTSGSPALATGVAEDDAALMRRIRGDVVTVADRMTPQKELAGAPSPGAGISRTSTRKEPRHRT